MKMYRVRDIVEILMNCQEIGIDGYCGFEINENGNLVITLKDHGPDWTDSDGFGAVSYTHLDVYKRQPLYRPIFSKPAGLVCGSRLWKVGNDKRYGFCPSDFRCSSGKRYGRVEGIFPTENESDRFGFLFDKKYGSGVKRSGKAAVYAAEKRSGQRCV